MLAGPCASYSVNKIHRPLASGSLSSNQRYTQARGAPGSNRARTPMTHATIMNLLLRLFVNLNSHEMVARKEREKTGEQETDEETPKRHAFSFVFFFLWPKEQGKNTNSKCLPRSTLSS